jgi:argininosuccinate lyase
MKGQPLAYNKDNQEDKEPLFDTADTVIETLRVFAEMVAGIEVKPDAMREAARQGYATATDLADYLVRKGVPFREAHEAVAQVVRHAESLGKDLSELQLDDLRRFSERVAEDVFDALTLEGSLAARDHVGGTAPARVEAAIVRARATLASQASK